jgi:hypothetical protein
MRHSYGTVYPPTGLYTPLETVPPLMVVEEDDDVSDNVSLLHGHHQEPPDALHKQYYSLIASQQKVELLEHVVRNGKVMCKYSLLLLLISTPLLAYWIAVWWAESLRNAGAHGHHRNDQSAADLVVGNTLLRTGNSVSSHHRYEGHIKPPETSIYNEYTKLFPYSGFYKWKTILEPYRLTVLEVKDWSPKLRYSWYLDEQYLASGHNVTVTFSAPTGIINTLRLKVFEGDTDIVVVTKVRFSVCLSVCLSLSLSVCLSVCLSSHRFGYFQF